MNNSHKKIDKVIMYLGMAGAIVGFMPFVSTAFLRNIRDRRLEDYVNSHLPTIVRKVEDTTNLKLSELPLVEFDESKELAQEPKLAKFLNSPTGCYSPNDGRIHLYSGVLRPPTKDLGDFAAELFTYGLMEDVRPVIAHEIGHFYTDQLVKRRGNRKWRWFAENGTMDPNFIARKLIGEGIAEYFRREYSGEGDEFKDLEWPRSMSEFRGNNRVYYLGGYHLVKPIIKKFGERGVAYLIENVPRIDDLLNLPAYQRRTLQTLSIN